MKQGLLDKLIDHLRLLYRKNHMFEMLDSEEARQTFLREKLDEMSNVELVQALEEIGVDYV